MLREPVVELFRPLVDLRILIAEVDGAEVVDDASAAGDDDASVAQRSEGLADAQQVGGSGRIRLRDLDDRDARLG